jgi:hypothetical protein
VDTAEASGRGALLHAWIGTTAAATGGVDHEVVRKRTHVIYAVFGVGFSVNFGV